MDSPKVQKTTNGVIGVMTGVMSTITGLNLSTEQIDAFCDATRNGSALWDDFSDARKASKKPNSYGFDSYVTSILENTDYPVAS